MPLAWGLASIESQKKWLDLGPLSSYHSLLVYRYTVAIDGKVKIGQSGRCQRQGSMVTRKHEGSFPCRNFRG